MNAPSALQPNEEIRRQERLHPAVFGLPVFLLILLLLPTIPLLFFFNMMGNMFGQISPQGPHFPVALVWLILILTDLLPALLLFIFVLVAYLNSQITLTNKRLLYRTGFLVRAAGELPLENVEAIFVVEPFLGCLLGYGTVTVSTLGGLRLPLRVPWQATHLPRSPAKRRRLSQSRQPSCAKAPTSARRRYPIHAEVLMSSPCPRNEDRRQSHGRTGQSV